MPLIVRELVVRATVDAKQADEAGPSEAREQRNGEQRVMIDEAVAEVLRILREREER